MISRISKKNFTFLAEIEILKSVHCQLAEASLTTCFPTAPKRMLNGDKLDILFNRRKHMVLYIFHLYKTDVSVYWSTIHSCRSTNPHISTISTNMSTTSTNIVKRTHDGAGRISPKHASTSVPVSVSVSCDNTCTVHLHLHLHRVHLIAHSL